jgi:hypothetical protein
MPLHDRSDDELKAMLAAGALGKKRAEIDQAVIKRRRSERLKEWLSRHCWPLLSLRWASLLSCCQS